MPDKQNIQLDYLSGLLIKCCIALICGTLVSATIAWWIYGDLEARSYGAAMSQFDRMEVSLARVTILCAGAQVIFAVGMLWVIGIYASNKIAGPLVRFERNVRSIGEGKFLQPIQFRAGDQDQSLPMALEDLKKRLRSRIDLGKTTADELSGLSQKLASSATLTLTEAEAKTVLAEISRFKLCLENLIDLSQPLATEVRPARKAET